MKWNFLVVLFTLGAMACSGSEGLGLSPVEISQGDLLGSEGASPDVNFTEGTGADCIPNCTGKECGDNGCGGICGACGAGKTCIAYDCAKDTDGDGDPDSTDCAPTDPTIYHGATEVCNGKDDDCDGITDVLTKPCFTDCGGGIQTCLGGSWSNCTVQQPLSCMDYADCTMKPACVTECPAAPIETCNGVDDNCDGTTDEGSDLCQAGQTCYEGSCCSPSCLNGETLNECGDDHCGGSCGTCIDGEPCEGGACMVPSGVWIDPNTNLVWQKESAPAMAWADAMTYCKHPNLPGTGWHLPNISELRTLVQGCPDLMTGGACGAIDVCPECGVTTTCVDSSCTTQSTCTSCDWLVAPLPDYCYENHELYQGVCGTFWSSSFPSDKPKLSWAIDFGRGTLGAPNKTEGYPVRCVRSAN